LEFVRGHLITIWSCRHGDQCVFKLAVYDAIERCKRNLDFQLKVVLNCKSVYVIY